MPWSNSWATNQAVQVGVDLASAPDKALIHFRVKDGNRYRNVTAEVVGDLALEYDDDGWCIHHVPTLTKFDKAVPSYLYHAPDCPNQNEEHTLYCRTVECEEESYSYDKQPLLNWMKKVQENYQTAWAMLRLLTPENYASNGESAKQLIKKWCLSVKVE